MLAYIFNLGPAELGIILVIIMLFFGAGKLPQVLSQMGKGVRSFKEGMKECLDYEDDGLSTDDNNEAGGASAKKILSGHSSASSDHAGEKQEQRAEHRTEQL